MASYYYTYLSSAPGYQRLEAILAGIFPHGFFPWLTGYLFSDKISPANAFREKRNKNHPDQTPLTLDDFLTHF